MVLNIILNNPFKFAGTNLGASIMKKQGAFGNAKNYFSFWFKSGFCNN